jgi:large subunit ribosomal protein L10
MALTKAKKKALVEDYKSKIQNSKAMFVLRPQGITPNEASELKKKLYDQDSSFNVVKNTLFRIALKDANAEIEVSEGENAVIFAGEDFPGVAKTITEFIKESKKAEIRNGFVEGKLIDKVQFETLSNLPTRDVLVAQVLATMQAPITSFVRVLNGNLVGFARVVNAIKEQKEKAA